jgi:flap endonuclease-1
MGLKIKELVDFEPFNPSKEKGKIFGFDAYITLYQFLTSVRQNGEPLRDSKGRITSHLYGLFYKNLQLLEMGIKIVYVFDGPPREEKLNTLKKREERRKEINLKYREAVEKGDVEAMRKYGRFDVKIDPFIVESAKNLLGLMGIPTVDAPHDAEQVLAHFSKKGSVDFVITQDYDALLFGAKNIVRNLQKTPEILWADKLYRKLEIDREKFIWLALLIGTDFNEKVSGIGPKSALKLVKKYDSFEDLLEKENIDIPDWRKIYSIFTEDLDLDVDFCFSKPKKEVVSFLEEFDFNANKINGALEKYYSSSSYRQRTLF